MSAPTATLGDRHALDDEERIPLHQHPVGEGPAVALVGVADDVLLVGLGPATAPHLIPVGNPAPPRPRRPEATISSTTASGSSVERARQPLETAVRAIVVERQRVGDAAAREDETLLAREEGDLLDKAQRLRVIAAAEEAGLEQRRRLRRAPPARSRSGPSGLDLDERLEPEEAARAGADDRRRRALAAPRARSRAATASAPTEGRRSPPGTKTRALMRRFLRRDDDASSASRSSRPTGSPSISAAGDSAQLPRQ